jgi:CCR4-NOT complex subunit CAF16
MEPPQPVVEAREVSYRYPGDPRPALDRLSFTLEAGSRCLLVGRNGAGKTTLLQVLAGKRLVPEDRVRVLGRPAFHDTSLAGRVSFLGGRFPFDVDIAVDEILSRQPEGIDGERRDRLVRILEVDRSWHMHRISDGQRRRVQLLLGLLRPVELLLLDEITTDLDLVARTDLLRFLVAESERGATVLYATHILDGLDEWATHLALMDAGAVRLHLPLAAIPELAALRDANVPSPLLRMVERWLRDLA